MAPPSFFELGKLCRDLLNKGYLDGLWRIDCRTLTSPGVHFNTSAQATRDNNIIGFIESKFQVPDTNVFLTGRWHTDNLVFAEVAMQDQFYEGLRLALNSNFQSSWEDRNFRFVAAFAQPAYKVDMDMTIASNPLINLSGVLGYESLLGGVQTVIDTSENDIKLDKWALGYVGGDYVIHLGFKNGVKDVLGSLFWRMNETTDIGIEANLTDWENFNDTKVTVGTRYRMNENSLIRAKIDNEANLSLGYQHRLRSGVTAYISSMVQCKDIQEGNHKIGVGFEIEYGLAD